MRNHLLSEALALPDPGGLYSLFDFPGRFGRFGTGNFFKA
jgi:hypothetical protein